MRGNELHEDYGQENASDCDVNQVLADNGDKNAEKEKDQEVPGHVMQHRDRRNNEDRIQNKQAGLD